MKMERQHVGTVEILSPQGALADDEAAEFCHALEQRLSSPNPRVAICLKDVAYLDSQALDGLVAAADSLMDRGSRLKLVAVSATCREILELTGLSGRFQFFEDPNDAARSFL